MVTPHLPPEHAANALLPVMLGEALAQQGVVTTYVSHPPRGSAPTHHLWDITYVPRRGRGWLSRTKAGAVFAGLRMLAGAMTTIRQSDLVHLHSNGFIIEVGQWLCKRYGKPYIVTLYGTDISSHDPARHARFAAVVRDASCRVFYSQGLLEQGRTLGLAPEPSTVIYAPVARGFRALDVDARRALRHELGIGDRPLLLTVKRLHPVAGHPTLLDAMPLILKRVPDARLWLAGEGEARPQLERQCERLGITSHVRFLGAVDSDTLSRYYPAADVFVLPSDVESWGTVMLESLACGTRVVTTDTVGGTEVRHHFPQDVTVVPRRNSEQLADAVCDELVERSRASSETLQRLEQNFSVESCAAQYLDVYRQAQQHRAATRG